MAEGSAYTEILRALPVSEISKPLTKKIKKNWDDLAIPLDSMGKFSKILTRIGAILKDESIDIGKKIVLVMCADNGIVAEGISQSGQEVTRIVAEGMGQGQSSVCKMAMRAGIHILPVDVGINTKTQLAGVRSCKIREGSRNFLQEPAMTPEETLQAITIGMEQVREFKERGCRLIGTGEMGIGNTTTSSAVATALLREDVKKMTGRGAGLDDERLKQKCSVIEQALKKYGLRENDMDAFTILQTVGGYDIAALTGVFIGGAVYGLPIVLDGIISMTAALVAVRIRPEVREFLIPSHESREPAVQTLMEALQVTPVIQGDMALGEGTGAVMMMKLLDMAAAVYQEMRTFSDAKIDPYERFDAQE